MFIYILPVASLAFTCTFPSALCLYWCTANFHSLATAHIMKIERFRKLLGIPAQDQSNEDKQTTMSSIIKFKDAIVGKRNFFQASLLLINLIFLLISSPFQLSPFADIKGTYQKHRNKSNIQNMEKTDQQTFDSAGSGPIQKTFKYDPTKKKG